MIQEIRNIETNELKGYKKDGMFIPLDKANRHYQEILEAIKNGEEIIPAFTEEERLQYFKNKKKIELNQSAQKDIVLGFTSSALGDEHLYQSEETDQLNLLGVVQTAQLTSENQLFKCSPDGTTWEYKEHTPEQLIQVLSDGKTAKETILVKCADLKAKVDEATTIDEINAVTWDE